MLPNTPTTRLPVALSEANQLCENFQTLESDFRILQGAFDIKIPTNASEYKAAGLSSGSVFYELNERARKLLKTVKKREVTQEGASSQLSKIMKEQTDYDDLYKTFGDMREDLKGLRMKFEGPTFFEYPTTSAFQLIGNQMAPPGLGKSKRKWSPRTKTPSNNLAETSPASSPMTNIKIGTNIQNTEILPTQSAQQLPALVEDEASVSAGTLSTNTRRSSRTQSRSRKSFSPSTSLSDPPTDIDEDVLTSPPKPLQPKTHETLQEILRKSISKTPSASTVLNIDGTFKSTTPTNGALPNKTSPTPSPVVTRKRSREAELSPESNKSKKPKTPLTPFEIANFRLKPRSVLEPIRSAQTIWERRYNTLPPFQQAVKDLAFDHAMRLVASLTEDLNYATDQNYKLKERVKKLSEKLAKYEGKKAAVNPKRKRSTGQEAGEKGDKSFKPSHRHRVSS
jgi:hypothetical protein